MYIIGSSEYIIFEFRVWYHDKWQYEIVESFMNPLGNLKGEEIIKKNEKYLAVLYDTEDSKHNILIWKRKQTKKSLPIFTTLAQKDFKIT